MENKAVDKDKTCSKCAYGVHRTDPDKFSWLDYECTNDVVLQSSHLPPYRYKDNTCEYFLSTERDKFVW